MGCGVSTNKVNAEPIMNLPSTGSEAALVSQNLIQEHTGSKDKITDTYLLDDREDWILGSGATSTVRKIQNKLTKEFYALKALQINRMKPDKVKELLMEVQMMKKLDHPNIIRVIETYRTHNTLYIVMELCTGGELFDKLYDQPNAKFSEENCRALFNKMVAALFYLHQAGIAHRDLKLENFIFTTKDDNAEVKLIDFGFSQNYLSKDHMNSIVGTAYYIAPEVLNQDYTKSCDIWSMGVILFMMLSGRVPFGGQDDEEIQEAVRTQDLIFHRKQWSNISPAAIDLVKQMINRDEPKRLTCKGVLNHPWMKGDHDESEEHTELAEGLDEFEHNTFDHMKKFKNFNQLKKTALVAIAFSLGDEQLQQLRLMFHDLDKEKTGVLSLQEFQKAMHEHSDIPDDEVKKIFESLDQVCTGLVPGRPFEE